MPFQTFSRAFYFRAVVVILVASAVLCLWRLDHASFWDDEAHIAIVARNFVHTGTLSGWDGRNLIGYRNGSFLDANFRSRNAPLDSLLAAASFSLLGPSTFAARLPFVLFGLGSLVPFAYLLRREFRARPLVLYALAYFALGMVFVLNARTCRYNALAMGFPTWAYVAYRYYLGTKRAWALWGCALALVGLFYASFLFAATFGGALVFVAVFYHRAQFTRRDRGAVLGAVLLFLMATVPYIVRYQAWNYPRIYRDSLVTHIATLLVWNLRDLGAMAPNIWPVTAIAVFVACLKRTQRQKREVPGSSVSADDLRAEEVVTNRFHSEVQGITRVAREWIALCLVYVLILCVFSPQPVVLSDMAETRYLLPIAPFLAGLVGVGLWRIHRAAQPLGMAMLGIAVCLNIPFPATYLPQESAFWRYSPLLLPAYVRENVLPYPTSTDLVLAYLSAHPLPNQKIVVLPPHMNLPLMFYAGEHLQMCCQLGSPTLLPPAAAAQLDATQFATRTFPDRILIYGERDSDSKSFSIRQLFDNFQRPHREGGRLVRYRYQREATLPIFWDEVQRPELFLHSFGPMHSFRKDENVFIYRRTLAKS